MPSHKNYDKMDPEIKERWTKALRSGRYEQAEGRLSENIKGHETNCCLGVLCRIERLPKSTEWRVYVDLTDSPALTAFRDKVGLPRAAHNKLCALNDQGNDFKTIADFIEREL